MRIRMLCVLVLGVLLAGCGHIVSDHPLSGEADSVLDERLIGVWEPVLKVDGLDAESAQQRFYVGRLKGSKRTLEVVTIDIDKEQHIEINRFRVYATHLGKSTCLSMTDEDGKEYGLVRYDIDENGRLLMSGLDEEKVVAAIRNKKIAGRLKEYDDKNEKPFGAGKYEEVRLTAPTKALRAWLESAPDVWVKADKADAHFRKLDLGESK